MPAQSPKSGALKILLGGVIAAGCSLTSLDRYFVCEPGHPDCKDAAVEVMADAGSGATDAGGNSGASAGESAGGESVGGTGGGTGALGGGGAGDSAGSGGNAGSAGNGGGAGATGAGRGESCVASKDCAQLTCFRNICGDPLELSYLDTPDATSVPTAARWIKFEVLITNRTTDSYALSRMKFRYYYSEDGVTSEFQLLSTTGSPPTADTDVLSAFGVTQGWTYLEVSFDDKAGTLGPGKQSGAVKVGVHDEGFGTDTFIEPGDYSYVPDVGMSHAPTANRHVTLYVDSVLVSGEEPKSPPPT